MSLMGHTTWVMPESMERSWLPEYFAPRFREVDEALLSQPQKYLRLGDLVRPTIKMTKAGGLPTWVVRRRGRTMSIERPEPSDDLSREEASWMQLPYECLVIHPMAFEGSIAVTFWSKLYFGEDASTIPINYVLTPKGNRDIAWVAGVFSHPFVEAQIERAAALLGSVSRIQVAELLELRIPKSSPEQERNTSDLVRRTLKKNAERSNLTERNRALELSPRKIHISGGGEIAARAPMLTAATFEQRLEQFERFLIEDQVADNTSGFLAQAARENRESDLFVIRPIGEMDQSQRTVSGRGGLESILRSHEDEDVNRAWRRWYWDIGSGINYEVFNSITDGPDLPTHLLLMMRPIFDPRLLSTPIKGKITVPAFAEYRAAIQASQSFDGETEPSEFLLGQRNVFNGASGEIGRLWERLNPGVPPTEEVVSWLRTLFRPVLAIRIMRENSIAGVYLLFGGDQLEAPGGTVANLETLALRLSVALLQPSKIAEDAARSESIRRLSWMMHQLGGPLSRIGNVVEELVDFAAAKPEVAATLLPNDRKAKARAKMNKLPLEEYTLGARLAKLEAAVEEIRRLRYLIRRYKNAQGELQLAPFDLSEFLDKLAEKARVQFPEIRVHVECESGLFVVGDRGLIGEALEEVLNNAGRECRLRGVEDPSIAILGARRGDRARIAIEDNGLPTDVALLSDVFAEDASTYKAQGKGNGLGLAIVKETFLRHGSPPRLVENTAADDFRRPGVTFWAELQVAPSEEENDRV
ncbi:MAG: HAMP domain-containing histidine kinase [Acidobacteria bacterium]|nr:HAMP domain-containing histidine kinase [Acidobacteriota bacterium]